MQTDSINKPFLACLLNIRSLALLVGLATFVIYLPALQNGFVSWDDNFYIYENDHIRHLNGEFLRWAFTGFHAANWHPLTWLSHAVDYAFWGLDPWGHHLSNILLHSVNALLVTLLIYRLLRLMPAFCGHLNKEADLLVVAVMTGLLFGLHPLHVESVAWVSERKDLLCALFYLLSLLFYLRLWRNVSKGIEIPKIYGNPNYLICLVLFMLALMSKPMAISLPWVLLLIDGLYRNDHSVGFYGDNWMAKMPFFLLAFVSAVITIAAQKSGSAISSLEVVPLLDRLLVACYALVAYLQKMIWPVDLLPYYAYPKEVEWNAMPYILAVPLVIAITTASVLSVRWHRGWMLAWGYYLITLLPVLGIVQVGSQAMADRYIYLPSIAPFMVFSIMLVLVLRCVKWQQCNTSLRYVCLLFISTAVLIWLLSSLTHKQIRIWRDGESLWHYVIQYNDQIPLAYRQLGITLYERAQYADAAAMMNKALSLSPLDAELLNNLAICYLELGDLNKAMQTVRRALNIEANNLFALNTLGEIYMTQRDYHNANKYFFQVMQLEPDNPLRLFNLAVSFDRLKNSSQACIYWRRYMVLDVTDADDVEIIQHLAKLGCPVD